MRGRKPEKIIEDDNPHGVLPAPDWMSEERSVEQGAQTAATQHDTRPEMQDRR